MAKQQKAKTKSAVGTIFLIVFLGIVLVILGGAIFYGIQTKAFTVFTRLELNGKNISATTNKVMIKMGENEFKIKNYNPFDSYTYTVKIAANPNENFHFMKDGNPVAYSSIGDLTQVFPLETRNDGFTLTIPSEFYSMKELLSVAYPDSKIDISTELENKDYFLMRVNFSNGEILEIYFGIDFPEFGFTLDPPNIIF